MNFPFRYGINSVLLNDHGTFRDAEFILGVEPRRGALMDAAFELDCSGADSEHVLCKNLEGTIIVRGSVGTRASVIFDIDDDGDLDIVTGDFNGPPMVLVSNLAQREKVQFLKIRLWGTKSNRDGLGSVVRVTAGGKTYTKVHDGQSGYLSQSSMPLYFGLADAEVIDEIRIQWPSGTSQKLSGPIKAGRHITISESDD